MSPALIKLLPVLKNLALRTVAHKLAKESKEDAAKRFSKKLPAPIEFDKKKLIKTMPSWGLIVVVVLTYLSSTGTIDPALYELVSAIIFTG